jgi:hypothetical protein
LADDESDEGSDELFEDVSDLVSDFVSLLDSDDLDDSLVEDFLPDER